MFTTPPNSDKAKANPGRVALSAEELAEMLGVSRSHVFRMASSGLLPPAIRFGRVVRWSRATIEDWVAAGAPPRDTWEALLVDGVPNRAARSPKRA